jgi:hypothetical protein
MKTSFSLITIILLTICISTTLNAQKKDCIICPEMLGIITSSENGVNVSTLTPNQNSTIIVSSETNKTEKAKKSKSSKKANRQKIKQKTKQKTENDGIAGFADVSFSDDTKDKNLEDCGCDGSTVKTEKIEPVIETFILYPNPAHHWVIINSKNALEGNYKLFLKDSQGRIIKERNVSDSSTKLDLRDLKKGVYFVTLRNEDDFSTTVKKVTVQ